jgi:putative ABC transport system permease protein
LDSLVAANLRQRPLRTAISVVGVSLGVILVVLFVGLARGMMGDTGRRQANVDAEVRFMSGGNQSLITNPLMLPEGYVDAILHGVQATPDDPDVEAKPAVQGVKAATPVGEWLKSGSGSMGYELIDGIDYPSFIATTRLQIIEGRGLSDGSDPTTGYEAIVDRYFAETNTGSDGRPVKVGSKINELGQDFTVVGIYEPSLLARVKIPLKTLQQLLGGVENCTFIMIKCERPELADQVIDQLNRYYPGHLVVHRDQIPALYSQSFEAVRIFLNVVIGLAVVISALVILLAMYTTIIERTREIGILKSLGASRGFIIRVIEKEAALISAMGVLFGFAVAVPAKFWIEANTRLKIDFEPGLILLAASIGIFSGIIGALYPAMRAAKLDAVEAISYE